jgi:penicillin-binding protein 1A
MWLIILASLLFVAALFFFISKKLLPNTSELENPKYEIATSLLDDSNKEMDKIYKLNREWIKYEDLNQNLVDALIATEDVRFLSHSGIDARGTARAIAYMSSKGGASTITQQLAKLFFTQRSSSFIKRVWQKLKEWAIAVEFEKRYTKEEILAMYLNKTDFLYNAIGIGSAAKTYFGKDQKELNKDEAAVLIAMLKNPGLYNPVKYPENCINRRNVVLNQMRKVDFITDEEYKENIGKELDMNNFKRIIHYEGTAPYFRAKLIAWLKDLLNDDKYKKPDGTKYDIFTDGLKVYTTLNSTMQNYAEIAMKDHMSSLQQSYFNSVKYDPWETHGDSESIKIRQNDLLQSIRDSDRYSRLRKKHFSNLTQKINQEIENVRLLDADIFRLYSAEEDLSNLNKLLKAGTINKSQAATYKKILSSSHWKSIKKAWTSLKKDVDKSFNTSVSMIVFDYEKGEKRVNMSPLDSIKYHQKHLQLGSIAVDPKTGHVKSWVGGINFKYFQYDHVESNRQVGSTFKPFIYSTAIIDHGMSPCQKIQDIKYTVQKGEMNQMKPWSPENSDGKNTGEWLTIKQCLYESKNSCSVFLMKEIGSTERVREFVDHLGIDKNKIPNYPSICLGTPELSVMDMATAYTSYANNGVMTKPIFVTKIEDKDGKLIYAEVPEKKTVINPDYNFVIVDLMKYAAKFIAPNFKSEVAGKTGTTDDYRDGWFMGFTPELVVATWVGGDKQWVRFDNLRQGQGGVMARPFFMNYMKRLEADPNLIYSTPAQFPRPENPIVEIDCDKYKYLDKQEEKQKEDELFEDF